MLQVAVCNLQVAPRRARLRTGGGAARQEPSPSRARPLNAPYWEAFSGAGAETLFIQTCVSAPSSERAKMELESRARPGVLSLNYIGGGKSALPKLPPPI